MDKDLNKIINVIKYTLGKDIFNYNQNFILKSLERRWTAVGVKNAAEYCDYIEKNYSEADTLYESLHITFSKFFRDPLTFAILEKSILPGIISRKPAGSEIRIWSAGCSSGQEAYSVAMLLSDIAETSEKEIPFRIFATDVSEEALDVGRAGVYDQNAVQDVRLRYLNKYFINHGKTFTIIPQLRRFINFSNYDLLDLSTANPPESIYGDFDIVICCNLLIYYKSNPQQFIIHKLQHALTDEGYLVTGEAEKNLVEDTVKLQMIATPTTVFKNNKRRRF